MDLAFYRFRDREEFLGTLDMQRITLDDPPGGSAFDEVGRVPGAEGWHVNAAWNLIDEPAAFARFRIHPETPARVFAQRR